MSKVAVIGAGSWGTTFAKVLADAGSEVVVWARRREVAQEITFSKRNSDYLAGVNLPDSLTASTDLAKVVSDTDLVFLAIPSQTLRQNLADLKKVLAPETTLVSLMKGLERGTRLRMTEVISEEINWPQDQLAVASGPNLAMEIAKEEPTAAVVSANSLELAKSVAKFTTNRYFRSFVNDDLIGTEFSGILKNLIAVAVGIIDGVGYGENSKASIITRGLDEMVDFIVAYGGKAATVSGLAGLGDLIATCESPLSRNNQAGKLLGQGASFQDVVDTMRQTAEGLASVAPVLELAQAKSVRMPIVEQVAKILEGSMPAKELSPQLDFDPSNPQGE